MQIADLRKLILIKVVLEKWTQLTFMPLYKKGGPLFCNNYRTIALVSHTSKTLLRVILEGMQKKYGSEIAQDQAGFRQNRGTCGDGCLSQTI